MSFCINPKCASPANEDADMSCKSCGTDLLLAGQYRVKELLSSSTGFGLIYTVFCQNSQKILKVLDLEVLKKKASKAIKALEHFEREAEVLQRLNHPGIPRGEEYFKAFIPGSEDILYCLVMEKIQGLDLAAWLEKNNNTPISENLALNWLNQIAEIVHAIHEQDLFHRDIKPSNIMLQPNGKLVLIDFGTVRKTGPTYVEEQRRAEVTSVHSVGYAPLEQEIGKATPQSDFFAIGRTFVHLLTGVNPNEIGDNYRNANTDDSWDWRSEAPKITSELADFIDYLMSRSPSHRPPNSQILLEKLNELIQTRNPQRNVPSNETQFVNICEPASQFEIRREKTCGSVSTWHSSTVTSVVMTTGGTMIISASVDGFLKFWHVESGEHLHQINLGLGAITSLCISPDEKTLLAACDTTIAVCTLSESEHPWNFNHTRNCDSKMYGKIMNLSYCPDGQSVLVATQNASIRTYNPNKNFYTEQIYTHYQSQVTSLDIDPEGSYFISSGDDGIVRLWCEPHFFQHDSAVLTAKISSRNGVIVSATDSEGVKVWNIITGDLVCTLQGEAEESIYVLLVSQDENFLIGGGESQVGGTITIWDLNSYQKIKTFNAHMEAVTALAISPEDERLISGSRDKSVKIWKIEVPSSDMPETLEKSRDE
jgi:serine/threonine protein kinase